uniref:CCHC-type domain-containing protein n=1 Tax=Meloidogyne javanica TaxID=6303 RepID=A0A915LKD7_MELJA
MRRSSFSNNFKQKYLPKMSIISLSKFASELFDCREELAIWRLHSSPFDRKRLERALIEVENNGGWIKAWGNGPLEIISDKPEEAVVPSGMKKSWWSGSCTQTFEELKDYLTEDEDGDTIVGPGILREDNVRETSEFFPYSSIFIEENKAEEEDNYYPRVVEELPWFEVHADAPGEESGTVKGIVADMEIPEGIIEELKFEYFKGKKANARAVVRPEKHFDVHGREVANIEVKFNLRFKMTGIGILMFLLIIGVAKAIPEKDAPLEESEIWDKYIDNDDGERESSKTGSVLLTGTNNVNQGLVSATLSEEQMRSRIEAIVQDLLITKPSTCSTSSNPLFNSVTSNNSNLLTTQQNMIQPHIYQQIPNYSHQNQSTSQPIYQAQFNTPQPSIPLQQHNIRQDLRRNAGGPIRNRRRCFNCLNIGHLAKNCSQQLNTAAIPPSPHNNRNSSNRNANSLQGTAIELRNLGNRSNNELVAQLLWALARLLVNYSDGSTFS